VIPLLRWLAAVWLLAAATVASAQEVQLRGSLAVSRAPAAMASAIEPEEAEWTWLRLRDPGALREMPAGWQLLIDQVRFEDIAVVTTTTDGTVQRQVLGADELQRNWAPGGLLKFEIAAPGPQVRDLAIGFHRIDDLALMRKVTAATPRQATMLEARWLVLMGLFAGLLFSAFAYNLFVNAAQRLAFQRWYIGWVAATLAYGLTWSNLAAYVFPHLAGPLAVRLDAILVSLTVALGSMFLVSVIERGKVPARLARLIEGIALACIASGIFAADERLVPAPVSDLVLNFAMLACVVASLVTIGVAARRGSRVVWLYLLGWAPVIAVLAARLARNFGLVAQSDLVDLATFGAIAFESLVFSLVIADRFLILKKERDDAAASARGMAIEKETMRRAAHSDFLTGLGNRASFHAELRELFAQGEAFKLFLIDIDYLKELNDRQGHDAGDALLREIGAKLAELTRPGTSCARVGGDEFAVLCGAGDSERVASALAGLQGAPWSHQAWSGTLSLSIGLARSEGAVSPADLFQQADIALYEAKKLGRGRQQAFDDRLRQQIQSRLDLIKDAHWALRRDEFLLHFQPIIDLRASKLVGVEALLRWRHPKQGLLSPESFACVLADEEIGAAVQQRVIALAIAELKRQRGFTGTLAINVTAMDLQGVDSANRLLRQLAAAGITPATLCVEVTEGTLLGKAGEPAAALRVLHHAGVRIALDDFGTGYASLVHLKEIPVDTLKIDKSFVAGLVDPSEQGGHESEEIVRAVLALGHGLNKTVIAEGVETVAQLDRLRELGCEFAQGYLFGRPSAAFDPGAAFRVAA
jgi:diguanylate cyclase (GGDEF)-like protein